LALIEGDSIIDVVSEITTFEVIDKEVAILSILEGAFEVHDEFALITGEMYEEISLVHDGGKGFLGEDLGFIYHFQSIDLLGFLIINFPDFAKATLPNDFAEDKEISVV
jgi:hypothetical protein